MDRGPDNPSPVAATPLEARLTGSLPCAFCGYELQGLSIRGACPECGAAVRGTLLYRIEPLAEEFAPIYFKRLVAAGLVLWPGAALAAGLLAWLALILALLNDRFGLAIGPHFDPRLILLCTALSGLAALPLIRPSAQISWWKTALAVIGLLLYVPLLAALAGVLQLNDALAQLGRTAGLPPAIAHIAVRLLLQMLAIAIVLAMRPIGRHLTRRSLAIRTKRVDRQTLLAIAIAIAIACAGDLCRAAGEMTDGMMGQMLTTVGAITVGSGALLATLGLAGAMRDGIRIAGALLHPLPSLGQVTESPSPPSGRSPLGGEAR